MAQIKVQPSVLRNKAAELQTQSDALSGKMDELLDREHQLSTMWEGPAKESFHNSFMTSYENCQPFFQELKRFIMKLEETAQVYEEAEAQAEQSAAQRFSG